MSRVIESSHPTFEQVDAVASAFEALASNERHTLNMGESNVVKHTCGTVACHGGWYLFHKLSSREHHWTGHPAHDNGAFLNASDETMRHLLTRESDGSGAGRWTVEQRFTPRSRVGHLLERSAEGDEVPDYYDGAAAMAHDLGFDTAVGMVDHFTRHPDVWGNHNARVMMYSGRAFDVQASDYGELTLGHIAKHWRGVADRIKAIEEERKSTREYWREKRLAEHDLKVARDREQRRQRELARMREEL